ncbi:Hsp20/alpha crystallin family protein [Nesterenkonia sandarakina]|uniref:Hsp20/alpha crystallin family protein n=1 Tax=Nesterenkonia sandarakina TaxID=272918 RepID=A0A2T0YSA9_9MICC|nr:Hsp20/alpha crystallin family protein [Nesterenkonia sandarakina]
MLRESSTSFYRSVDLPEQALEQQITAAFDDDVLSVAVPLKPGTRPQPVPITNGHSTS